MLFELRRERVLKLNISPYTHPAGGGGGAGYCWVVKGGGHYLFMSEYLQHFKFALWGIPIVVGRGQSVMCFILILHLKYFQRRSCTQQKLQGLNKRMIYIKKRQKTKTQNMFLHLEFEHIYLGSLDQSCPHGVNWLACLLPFTNIWSVHWRWASTDLYRSIYPINFCNHCLNI